MGSSRVRDVVGLLLLVAVLARYCLPPADSVAAPQVTPTPSLPAQQHPTGRELILDPVSIEAPPAIDEPLPARKPQVREAVRPWQTASVNGISKGMTLAEVGAWLGPGERVSSTGKCLELHYSQPSVTVLLGSDKTVYQVRGTKLRLDGRVVLLVGDTRAQAVQAVGSGGPMRLEESEFQEVLYHTNSYANVYLRRGIVKCIVIGSRC